MPDWKDELKAEIGDLMRSLDFDSVIINNINVHKRPSTDLKQLCALILELIDHIPEEKDAMRLVRKSSIEGDK